MGIYYFAIYFSAYWRRTKLRAGWNTLICNPLKINLIRNMLPFGSAKRQLQLCWRATSAEPRDNFSFAKGLVLLFKRTRFAVQKDSFCNPKGFVLKCKRTPFENPMDFKWKVKREKWKIRWSCFVRQFGWQWCKFWFCEWIDEATSDTANWYSGNSLILSLFLMAATAKNGMRMPKCAKKYLSLQISNFFKLIIYNGRIEFRRLC